MAKSKLGMSSFDIDIKFKNKEEARRYAKRVLEKIRYICKKKNWSATAMVCISNTKGNSTYVHYEHNGKVGRPRKVKEVHPHKSNIEVDWHLHIIMASKPCHSFREELKAYFDKNWLGWKKNANIDISKLYGKGTYKKNTNIKKAEYFMNQEDESLFCTYNSKDEVVIPEGYTLKDLYNAYINSKTALRYARSTGNEKRLALEDKYNDIVNFYWTITKEQDKKMVDKFMKQAQLIKIQDNYDLMEKNNKVQENMSLHRRIVAEDSLF
ncbi:MAG: hypothetical protein HFI87_03950 [Bacilli bacterium]|nr:hypothetical protein [Bacilli bacterium]